MRKPSDVIHAFYAGDRVTDEEAIDLRDKAFVAAAALCGLGPVFLTARKEAQRIADTLADICEARGIGR